VAGRLTCESPRIAGHRIARAAHGSDDAARPSFALSAARSPLPSRSWTTSLPFASLSDGTSSCTFPGVAGRLRPLIVRRSCSDCASAAAASAASFAATSSAESVGLAAAIRASGRVSPKGPSGVRWPSCVTMFAASLSRRRFARSRSCIAFDIVSRRLISAFSSASSRAAISRRISTRSSFSSTIFATGVAASKAAARAACFSALSAIFTSGLYGPRA